MATSQDFANWICSEQVDRRFLVYLFLAEQDSLLRFASGAIHQTIYYPELKALHVCKPPLTEQQRIVAILDEAFAGLATASANTERNLENARELFDSYLNSAFSATDVEWKETTLGAIAEFKNGLNFTKSSKGEKIRIVGVKDFRSQFWVPMDELDFAQIDGGLSETYLLRKNDILTVRSNGNKQLIGRCILASDVREKISHSGFTIRIRIAAPNVNPVYLVRYLKCGTARKALIESGGGAQISNLNQQALTDLPIRIPAPGVQQDIVTRLAEIEAETDRLEAHYEQRMRHLTELKRSILQKVFSGKLTSPPSQAVREAAE